VRRFIAVVITAVATLSAEAACFATPSTAGSQAVTFSGQCQFTGTSSFGSPVTLVPSTVRNNVAASGTCSGTLIARNGSAAQLSNTAVQYRASELGTAESCAGDPDAVGSGALVFDQGTLRFNVTENRVGGQAALVYTGRKGGSATGVAYVSSSDPAGLLEQCATTGITSAPVQIVFQTTPSISG